MSADLLICWSQSNNLHSDYFIEKSIVICLRSYYMLWYPHFLGMIILKPYVYHRLYACIEHAKYSVLYRGIPTFILCKIPSNYEKTWFFDNVKNMIQLYPYVSRARQFNYCFRLTLYNTQYICVLFRISLSSSQRENKLMMTLLTLTIYNCICRTRTIGTDPNLT